MFLVPIDVASVYKSSGTIVPLPKRMAQCTPDMKRAIEGVAKTVAALGGVLRLSDLFRSYDMQLQSHLDYTNGKKKAFSPPPGGSLHEAGRALDLDLTALKMPLRHFWEIARPHGLVPIITSPDSGASESWHFDCRGSHDLVYQYYKSGKGNNFKSPYTAMAASAILAIGVKVDKFLNQREALLQAYLIRLGYELGNIDGDLGPKTREALQSTGFRQSSPESSPLSQALTFLENLLKERFPLEFEN